MENMEDVSTGDIMKFLEKNMVTREEFKLNVQKVEGHFQQADERLGKVEGRLGEVEGRLGHVENQMVTKDYLDNKLADLGSDIGRRINRQAELDKSFRKTLIDILSSKSILQGVDIERLKEFV